MSEEMRSDHVGVVISRQWREVYEFASDPDNLARWASGLAQAPITREGDVLVARSPMGLVRVRFVPHNHLGVLDHDVTLPSGDVVTNPMRVLAHPQGSEVVFTVRQLGMTDEEFERDVAHVRADLLSLKALLESDTC